MLRRRRTEPAGLLGLVWLLPWWVAVILAVLCYVALHAVSQMPISGSSGTAGALASSYIRGMVTVGQHALSLLLVFVAVVSVGKA
jgi:restriction system protein